MVDRQSAVAEDRGGWGARGLNNLIGIVLIAGITVVLVSFAAVFRTGLRDEVDEPPETLSTGTEYDDLQRGNGEFPNITHRAGANLEAEEVHIDVNVATTAGSPALDLEIAAGTVPSTFVSGDTLVLDERDFRTPGAGPDSGEHVDMSDPTVRFVYTASESADSTQTGYRCEVEFTDCE
jgi:FlaG/FlaF family flagellin (archaellin)